MTERRTFRVWLAEHLLHIGWAIFGQECDCGYNRFNWLAGRIGEGQWDAEGEPANLWTRVKFEIGHAFVMAHAWLMHDVDGECGRPARRLNNEDADTSYLPRG